MATREYTDVMRTEAMILLAVHHYDFDAVSQIMKVPPKVLRRWNREVSAEAQIPIKDLLERAIRQLLGHMPENMSGKDWGVALGILMDKYLLMSGLPTSRTQILGKGFFGLNDNELSLVLTEAERIISGSIRDVLETDEGGSLSLGSGEVEE